MAGSAAVQVLQAEYDRLIRARREVRREVREEFRERVQEEIGRRIEEMDREFAEKLKVAKDAGMKRYEIAEAVRSNSHDRIKYFLDLAGAGGFQRGRPAISVEEKVRRDVGVEVLDAGAGFIRVHEMRGVAVEPFEAVVYRRGSDVRIDPPEGVERFEQEAYDVYNSDVGASVKWLHRVMDVVEGSRG